MENLVIINTMIIVMMTFLLMASGLVAIGFFIGYKTENRKILKKRLELNNKNYEENEKERKAKKEWKKFLEYDGSAKSGVDN